MKTLLLILTLAGAVAHGDVVTGSTAGHEVAFTNAQKHFVWTPVAVIVARTNEAVIDLTITRYGNGQVVRLASVSATASNLIWAPTARYIFDYGSSLVVSSSVANFSIQLHREPAHD